MKKTRKKIDMSFTTRVVGAGLIVTEREESEFEKKDLKARSAYFLLNGAPEFSVNDIGNTRFKLLAAERDFFAAKMAGFTEFTVRVFQFTEKNAEAFSLMERLKNERLSDLEEARLMKKLVTQHNFTQNDVADLIGKSRPSVANAMRLLTLQSDVLKLVDEGRLSAGHARTLVKVPKEKQRAFAIECIKRKLSVREMERAVKAFLTPPEVLQKERDEAQAAKNENLKSAVERMRQALGTQVSLIGNDKKGRIYIDYLSADELTRIVEKITFSKEKKKK